MRIGIFGGAFDPVHQGHIALAQSALHELRLDHLFVVLSKRSPWKRSAFFSLYQRWKMLRMAFAKMPRCRVSKIEMSRFGTSYTVETLEAFRRKFPAAEIFLVMGSDSLKTFPKWKSWRKILKLCSLAVARRKGFVRPGTLSGEISRKIVWLKSELPQVSSTEIRSARTERSHD